MLHAWPIFSLRRILTSKTHSQGLRDTVRTENYSRIVLTKAPNFRGKRRTIAFGSVLTLRCVSVILRLLRTAHSCSGKLGTAIYSHQCGANGGAHDRCPSTSAMNKFQSHRDRWMQTLAGSEYCVIADLSLTSNYWTHGHLSLQSPRNLIISAPGTLHILIIVLSHGTTLRCSQSE